MESRAPLELVELGSLSATLGAYHDIGKTPFGRRLVVDVSDVTLDGPRVQATLAGWAAADWFTIGEGGVGSVDVRMTLSTGDGSLLLLEYQGRTMVGNEFPNLVAGHFEAEADGEFGWLNQVQMVGKGWVADGVVTYDLFELR